MIFDILGNTNLKVSKLGFGTMRLPVEKGNPDLTKAIRLLEYGRQKGINFFDVGTFYCHNKAEEIFSEALKHDLNSDIVTSGKNVTHQHEVTDWTGQLRNTLKIYNRPSLSIYFIHYLDYRVWIDRFMEGGYIEEVGDALKNKLFGFLAFSSHDTPENVVKLIETGFFHALLLPYNLLNREYEPVMKYANERGMGVLVMNALAGGLLSLEQVGLDSLLKDLPNSNMVEIALNYVLSNPYVHCVLSGMRSEAEVDRNINILLNRPRFSFSQLDRINELVEAEKSKQYFYCTGCNYCMPCTQGIDIPSVISVLNKYAIKTDSPHYIRDYAVLDQPASCCIACGVCETKCPNKLEISMIMKKAASMFME